MNRIILVGNGFDLAHGLETSYRSFIDNLWREKLNNFEKKWEYIDEDIDIKGFEYYQQFLLPSIFNNYNDFINYNKNRVAGKLTLNYKNKFMQIINKSSLNNWVDIENEYFKELREIVIEKTWLEEKLLKLNAEFLRIKSELVIYLTTISKNKTNTECFIEEIIHKINSEFKFEDFTKLGIDAFYNEIEIKAQTLIEGYNLKHLESGFSDTLRKISNKDIYKNLILDKVELKKYLANQKKLKPIFDFKPNSYLFVNFNYTNISDNYSIKLHNSDIINIHGELNSDINPVIFGYGDEIGKDYAIIEEVNNNDLLENVKSIRYLDTDNYKRLLEYIDSDNYQIFIMGHSCGNSDRTLLNTLFEHENCVSIKLFYYKESETKDNYSDVIRNISRNFNDKKLMREKVVNKMYCSPLVRK